MNSISVTLCQEEQETIEHFLNTFQNLSLKQKKIWQLLHWYSTHYRNVFPSHATIAEKVGCCRDTVINSIKLFTQNKWLVSIKRCFRSSQYFMCDFLKKFDTRKNETFSLDLPINSAIKSAPNPTLYNVIKESKLLDVRKGSEKPETVQNIDSEKEKIFLKMGITLPKDIFCLSRYPLHIIAKAYEDLSTRWTKSGPINNLAAWITSRCKEYLCGGDKIKNDKSSYQCVKGWFLNGQLVNY